MSEVPRRGILASAVHLLIAEVRLPNFRLQERTFELHLLKPFAHPHPDSQNANPKGVRILAIVPSIKEAQHLFPQVNENRLISIFLMVQALT